MNNPRRIAIIGPAYPYRGGPAAVVAHLYELLSQQAEVRVFSFRRLYPGLLFPGTRQEDVSAHPIKPHPAERIIDSIDPRTWYATARAVAAFDPALILLDWYQPFFGLCYGTILRRLRRQTQAPIIVLAENIISHEARQIDWWLTRRTFRYADGFIAFSSAVADRLRTLYPEHPVARAYLPLFITPALSPTPWTPEAAKAALGLRDGRVVLFFGYIRPYKGLATLLDAFAQVQLPNTTLMIVGECYENPQHYQNRIAASSARERIRWIAEYVPNEHVPLYYTAADIVVLPYYSGTQSGVQRIAFAFGKPVVVTDVGGLAEEVRAYGAGLVVPPRNASALADAIEQLLSNAKLREQCAQGARVAAEQTRFERIIEAIDQVITQVQSRRP
ncbi:MAG: glycosyltransferase family 4 protein [Candidatus Kapabacteria bacterium]|nr:glycosyltransferase family 4 protein [Candidatus Kapabacteria bacterium]